MSSTESRQTLPDRRALHQIETELDSRNDARGDQK